MNNIVTQNEEKENKRYLPHEISFGKNTENLFKFRYFA